MIDTVLDDDAALQRLLAFAKDEYSEENVLFFIKAKEYREFKPPGGDTACALGAVIIDRFLCAAAPQMINLPSHVANQFKLVSTRGEYTYTPDLFDRAMGEIRDMLYKDTFSRFKLSDAASELLNEKPQLAIRRSSIATATVPDHDRVDHDQLNNLMQQWKSEVGCDRITLWLIEPKAQKMFNVASTQLGNTMIGLPIGVGLAGMAAKDGKDIFVKDAYEDPTFNKSIDQATGYRTKAVCCVCLKDDDDTVIAVVQVINKLVYIFEDGPEFTPADAVAIRALKSEAMTGVEIYRKTPISLWKRL